MECEICTKVVVEQDAFFCASCARTSIYMSRLETVRLMLENETLHRQVATIVGPTATSESAAADIQEARTSWLDGRISNERSAIRGRIDTMQGYTTTLAQEIEDLRTQVLQRKKVLEARKNAMHIIEEAIPGRRQNSVRTLTEVLNKGATSFSNISRGSAKTRAFLCQETANLLRLRRLKRSRNGGVVEQYSITGSILPDLKEINNVRCIDLTASLTSAAHLLVLAAFYLGVRLPAEITNPHRDYPLPTINTPAQSYQGHKVAFPGSGSIGTMPGSPFSSRHEGRVPYRPRPLFIGSDDRDEKVAQFAKKDPSAFNFFLEGVSLLAWDIAWLCRSQGFSQGTATWEDICDIGHNLHQLILGHTQAPAIMRVLSSRDAQKRQKSSSGTSTPSQDAKTMSPLAKLGQASHLSTSAFLGHASFNEQFRSWKYSKYNTISDALKKLLVAEMNNAEWELLQEQEWDDGGEQFDEAVFIKARATDGRDFDDARSIMNARAAIEEEPQQSSTDREGKGKGKSGWTKVKSRSDG